MIENLRLSYKLNNKMKQQTSLKPTEDYNVIKIIEKMVEEFKIFLFDFINEEMNKFILPCYDLKKELQNCFKDTGHYSIDDTRHTLNQIFNKIIAETDYSHAPNFIDVIVASNQDLDFDNCEVEPLLSSDDRIICSYEFIFGDSQYGKLVDITKKAKEDMQSIIDKIIENEESFKGEVISLIDETDNKLNAIIKNYIKK
jgi:hypothetical protein